MPETPSGREEANDDGIAGLGAPSSRRSLLKKGAIGAAVAWTAPTVLSSPAFAGTSPVIDPPTFVPGSEATGFDGAGTKNVTLTFNNLQAGDLLIAIASYSDTGVTLPTGWSATAEATSGTDNGASVRSWVVWRVVTVGDLGGGSSFAATFSASFSNSRGGLRASGVAYRGSNLAASVSAGSVGTASTAGATRTSDFPAAPGAPLAGQNAVVRLGAARGDDGAPGTGIDWLTAPGTIRVDYNTTDSGDRAQVISEQIDNAGAVESGTWAMGSTTAPIFNTTFTAVITAS